MPKDQYWNSSLFNAEETKIAHRSPAAVRYLNACKLCWMCRLVRRVLLISGLTGRIDCCCNLSRCVCVQGVCLRCWDPSGARWKTTSPPSASTHGKSWRGSSTCTTIRSRTGTSRWLPKAPLAFINRTWSRNHSFCNTYRKINKK